MSITLTSTADTQLTDIRSFLLSTFQAKAEAPFANLDLLRWKYIDPRPDLEGSRGYAFRQDDQLVAYCGISPVQLMLPGREVAGICFMDWAGSRRIPGIGMMLMRKLMRLSEVAVVAGGSEAAQMTIPKMGFRPFCELGHYVRILRPLKLMRGPRSAAEPRWKIALRFLRNAWWSLSQLPDAPAGWSVKSLHRFDPESVINIPAKSFTLTRRMPGALNYWLRCPRGKFLAYAILHEGRSCGHFLLNHIGDQVRIVDIRIATEEPRVWRAAYNLATRTAAEGTSSAVSAVASHPLAREALLRNGFHLRSQSSIFLYDPRQVMAGQPPLHWNPIDDDSAIF